MKLISCPHCGIVVDLEVLRKNVEDRYAVRTYRIDNRELWQCHHCNARNEIRSIDTDVLVIPFKYLEKV